MGNMSRLKPLRWRRREYSEVVWAEGLAVNVANQRVGRIGVQS